MQSYTEIPSSTILTASAFQITLQQLQQQAQLPTSQPHEMRQQIGLFMAQVEQRGL